MALHGLLLLQQQLQLLGFIILAATAASQPSSSCERSCGSVSIPYPFGTSEGCYLDESFLITCNHTFQTPRPFLGSGNIDVLNISLDGELRVSNPVAHDCYDKSNVLINNDDPYSSMNLSKFAISYTKNKFTAVGCDTSLIIMGTQLGQNYTGGCISFCDRVNTVVNGSCSSIGCCQTSIPEGVTYFFLGVSSFDNHSLVHNFNPCGFGFLVEEKA